MFPRLTASCLVLTAATLSAQPVEPPFAWAQGQLAYLSQQNSACVKESKGFGLGAGRWFQPRWGYEATFLHSSLESKAGLLKAAEDHLDLTALYRPMLDTGRWIPFLRAGAGLTKVGAPWTYSDKTSVANLTAGVGLRVNTKPIGRIQPRPGLLFVFPLDNNSRADQHWGIMTSLVFEF